jgi:tetratricopeptide (TPR) repeat protein
MLDQLSQYSEGDTDASSSKVYQSELAGQADETGGHGIFAQDLIRMKAMLLNNLSTCYFYLGRMRESEEFNDLALMEDPDYAKGMLRKALILEKNGSYQEAHNIARFAISRFDDEFEDERNRKVVPSLVEVRDRLSGMASVQKKKNERRLQEEAEREMGFDPEKMREIEENGGGFFGMIEQFEQRVLQAKERRRLAAGKDAVSSDSSDGE